MAKRLVELGGARWFNPPMHSGHDQGRDPKWKKVVEFAASR